MDTNDLPPPSRRDILFVALLIALILVIPLISYILGRFVDRWWLL